jgi:NAD(P)-dependent dehydrogenase (short-subunit alcohol dehydrogenase family)
LSSRQGGLGGRTAQVGDSAQCAELARRAAAAFGRLDIFVSNAGMGSGKGVSNISDGEWERVMNVNVRACLAITRALLPGFRAQKFGRVITISSNVGAIGRGEAQGSG